MAVELPNELIKCVQTPRGELPGHTVSAALVKITSTPLFPNWTPCLSFGPQVSARWPSSSSRSRTWTLSHSYHLTQHVGVNCCSWFMDSSHGPSDREPPWDDLSTDIPKHHGLSATTCDVHIPSTEVCLHPGCTRLWLTKPCRCLGGSSKDN